MSTVEDITYLIQKEIDWCKENQDADLSLEFQVGFMAGLKQAQTILHLARLGRAARDGDNSQHWGKVDARHKTRAKDGDRQAQHKEANGAPARKHRHTWIYDDTFHRHCRTCETKQTWGSKK